MARFAIGDRAKFHKMGWMPEWQRRQYLGRVGIVIEVMENVPLPDGKRGEMIRIAYTEGSIRNIRAMAKDAMMA